MTCDTLIDTVRVTFGILVDICNLLRPRTNLMTVKCYSATKRVLENSIKRRFNEINHLVHFHPTVHMQKQEKDSIRRNWVRLSQQTPFDTVCSFMYQEGIFSKISVEDILWQRPSERPWAFLDTLQRSGPLAYTTFIQALNNSGRKDLVELLENGESLQDTNDFC